jgi:hypothetical protein
VANAWLGLIVASCAKRQKTRIVSKPVTSTFGGFASDAQIDYFSRFGCKYVSD